MARKRLVPGSDYGRSLYDWIRFQRRDDHTTWEAEDLSEWLAPRGVAVSGKQLRQWIKAATYPKLNVAAAIADLFGVSLDEMWKNARKPINLPQDRRPPAEGTERDPHADARQGIEQLGEVRKAGRRRRRGRTA